MLKNKKILIASLLLLAILLIPGLVNATVEYTRTIIGNNGNITLNLTGLELDSEKPYEFAIVTAGGTPETWHEITNRTENTATLELNSSTKDILSVLKASNTGYIYIREKDNEEEFVLRNMQVDLELPLLNAVNVAKEQNGNYAVRTIYGYSNHDLQFKWEKITDKEIVEKYLDYKKGNIQLSDINFKQTIPTSGFSDNWGLESSIENRVTLYKHDQPQDGLYYLWIQSGQENAKTIYGYYIHDGLPNATTLEEYLPDAGDTDNDDENAIDTTRYISFPMMIINGKGTLNLKSGVYDGDYTMYYQFIEVPEEEYNKLEDLKEQYEKEEITYEEFYTKYNETVTKYDESKWIKTEDGSFEQDLNKFTGTKKFALWVKLEMEDKTVYEAEVYTMNGSGSATTEEPDSTNKPGAEDTNKGDTNTKDPTIADKELPNTGKVILAWIIGVVAVFGIVAHIRYKKLYM